MRRLSKPLPPENVSPNGQPPRTFIDAERQYLAGLPAAANKSAFARSQFDSLDKGKLRAVMYEEQGAICAFCESSIAEGHPAPRIDHWRPLSINHDVALHWNNLYLSCAGLETCDNAKRDQSLKWQPHHPDLPWPTELAYESLVGFTSLGEIYLRKDVELDSPVRKALELAIDSQQDGTRNRPAILNLNHPALVAARSETIDSELRRMEKHSSGATEGERENLATDLLGTKPFPAFVSVRVAWLRKSLGNGR